MYTSWMDEKIIKWCKGNQIRVKMCRQPSILLLGIRNGYQELASLYEQVSILREHDVTKKLEEKLQATYNLIPQKINEGWEKLNKLNQKYGLEKLPVKKEKQTYINFIKTISHVHSH